MTPETMNNAQLLQPTQQWKERALEAEQRALLAEQRALEAEQRALLAEQRALEAEQWKERAQEMNRGLSWPEALSLWHTVYANPTIHFRHENIGAAHFTSPKGRRYPTRLCHWPQFHRLHEKAFKRISYHFANPESSAFGSRGHYESIAKDFMLGCQLNDEAELVTYQERAVEDLVVSTWRQMGKNEIAFTSGGGHPLADINNRVSQINPGAETITASNKRQYDKLCYVTTDQGARIALFVVEYKAADKLTTDLVKAGLHEMKVETTKERTQMSTETGARKVEMAEEVIVIVLTQIFDYMVNQGLSYGYVSGGNAFIFLCIDPRNPQNLYYEKVILEETSLTSSIDPDQMLRLTAVGLVAGFTKMAYDNCSDINLWTENLRIKARNELPIWDSDDSKMLEKLPETPKRPIDDHNESSSFDETNLKNSPDTSPAETRARAKARKDRNDFQSDKSEQSPSRKEDNSSKRKRCRTSLDDFQSESDESEQSPSRKEDNSSKRKRCRTSLDDNIQRPARRYCTQACLLGLIRGHDLDKKCPNVQAHRKEAREDSQNRHTLDQPNLVRLIDEQLQSPERNYNGGFKSLGRSGWAGALFRLELLSHGYTFVGKGTVQPLVQVLQIEATMYKRMDALQGKAIPVYLGNVDFKSAFHLTTQVAIVHLMLLSWAGEEAWKCGIESERLRLESLRTYHEVAALSVQQRDLRPPNVLWNFELDRAILIDFEYARINKADELIEMAIAEQVKAKKMIERLGQTRGNSRKETGTLL